MGTEKPRSTIPPPPTPAKPPEWKKDWVWVRLSELTPTSLVLGLLRRENRPVLPSEMVAMTRQYHPDINQGTIYNLGLRLRDKRIENGGNGWTLIDPATAPVIHDEYAWGPPSVFQSFDLAAFRREAVLHVLRAVSPDGLMAMQIVRHLQQFKSPRVPVDKTMMKVDLDILQGKEKVKQIGNSRKWALSKSSMGP